MYHTNITATNFTSSSQIHHRYALQESSWHLHGRRLGRGRLRMVPLDGSWGGHSLLCV